MSWNEDDYFNFTNKLLDPLDLFGFQKDAKAEKLEIAKQKELDRIANEPTPEINKIYIYLFSAVVLIYVFNKIKNRKNENK